MPEPTSLYTAQSTHGTTLSVGSTTVYIKDYPDLGGKPELIETTTLADVNQTFIPGIQTYSDFSFTANYESSVYSAIKTAGETAIANNEPIACSVNFMALSSAGTGTSTGSVSFYAFPSVFITGGGVNEVRNMTITLTPTSEIS